MKNTNNKIWEIKENQKNEKLKRKKNLKNERKINQTSNILT